MALRIRGIWTDGIHSTSTSTELQVDDQGSATITGIDYPSTPVSRITLSARVGSTPRYLRFADGAQFETRDHSAVEQLAALIRQQQQASFDGRIQSAAHLLEHHWLAVATSIACIAALVFWFTVYGAPVLARYAAFALPAKTSEFISEDTLATLDKVALSPSKLDQNRKQELENLFVSLLPADREGMNYHLVFREGRRVGPNAFALPDATVVLTDELANLAENDQQISAVLLHEIGHVKYRHMMRQVLQQSGLATVIIVLTGDIHGASQAVIALPGLLMQAKYSRDMEWEADGYALAYMEQHQLSPRAFAEIMQRLENWKPPAKPCEATAEHPCPDTATGNPAPASNNVDQKQPGHHVTHIDFHYLSTHPATSERIRRFEDAAARLEKN